MTTTAAPMTTLDVLGLVSSEMAHQLAVDQKVCVRPLVRRVIDQQNGTEQKVAIPCGSTHEDVCPSCADKARRLRVQQCAEGWHRTDEPETDPADCADDDQTDPATSDEDQVGDLGIGDDEGSRRVRSTRRRQGAADPPNYRPKTEPSGTFS